MFVFFPCTSPFTKHPRCSDEYADIKAVKLLRRGRRLQQVEQVQVLDALFLRNLFRILELSTGKLRMPIMAFLRLDRAKSPLSVPTFFPRPSGLGSVSNVRSFDVWFYIPSIPDTRSDS